MFDLLGFWAAVSFITFLFVMPLVWLGYYAAVSFMGKVLEDTYKGSSAVDKLVEFNYEGALLIKQKEVLPEWLSIISVIVGLIGYLLAIVHAFVRDVTIGEAMIEIASKVGEVAAPFAMYLVAPTVLYFGGIYVARKIIKIKAKLESINAKLNEVN